MVHNQKGSPERSFVTGRTWNQERIATEQEGGDALGFACHLYWCGLRFHLHLCRCFHHRCCLCCCLHFRRCLYRCLRRCRHCTLQTQIIFVREIICCISLLNKKKNLCQRRKIKSHEDDEDDKFSFVDLMD